MCPSGLALIDSCHILSPFRHYFEFLPNGVKNVYEM